MLFIHTVRLSRAPTERRGRVDGASLPQEGPEPEPYQPGHDEQRYKQKRLPLVGVRWHRIHCKGLKKAGALLEKTPPTVAPVGPTAGQGTHQSTREARPDQGAQDYADIKPVPGTQGHAAQDPTEHGPHKSAYSDSSGPPRFHVPTFSPPDARYY